MPYIMLSDGSAMTSVPIMLQQQQSFGNVAWLSDAQLLYTLYSPIAFGGINNGGEVDLFMTATTSGGEPKTLYSGINLQRPAGSPSQATLAFEAEHGPFQAQPNIDVETLDVSTLTLHILTHNDGTYIQAAWSPDGSKIAYACAKGKQSLQICTMNSDGTNMRILTAGMNSHQWPAWSPDSKRIAYFNEAQIAGKIDSTIFIVDVDDSHERAVTSHTGVSRDETPSWAPNGREIVFQTDRLGSGFRIAVVRPDGSALTMLTK